MIKLATIDQQLIEILNRLKAIPFKADKMIKTVDLITARINAEIVYPKIAFIGQYSAGKSTIIRALTSDVSIKIGEGVTTDKTATYHWGNIRLVDTPGILAGENEKHDEITMQEIDQSDLLIYVTTMNGFDHFIAENFKKIIIEENRFERCLLLINKVDSESEEAKIEISKHISQVVDNPSVLNRLNILFIDAKSYLEALEEDDSEDKEELLDISNFEHLKTELDRFAVERRLIAQYLAPLNLLENELIQYLLEATTLNEEATQLKNEALKKKKKLTEEELSLKAFSAKGVKRFTTSLSTRYNDIIDTLELSNAKMLYGELHERLASDIDEFYIQLNEQLHTRIEQMYEDFKRDDLFIWAERYMTADEFLQFKTDFKEGMDIKKYLKDSPEILKQLGSFIEQGGKTFVAQTQNKTAINKGLTGFKAAKDSALYKFLYNRAKKSDQSVHWATVTKKVAELGKTGEKVVSFGKSLAKLQNAIVPLTISIELVSNIKNEASLSKLKSVFIQEIQQNQENLQQQLPAHFLTIIESNIQPITNELNEELVAISESCDFKDSTTHELKEIMALVRNTIATTF